MTNNARFWVFVNGDWAKITLKPGQQLTWGQSHPTDEGWHGDFEEYTHAIDAVHRTCVSDGVDCDGRLTRTTHLMAALDKLHEVPCQDFTNVNVIAGQVLKPIDLGFSRPDWEEVSSYQYDQYAQAMNY